MMTDPFARPIGQVQRRMITQRFLSALVWALVGGFVLAALAVTLDRVLPSLPSLQWWPLAIAAATAPLAALLFALVARPKAVEVVLAIDNRYGLNERLTTAYTLPESMRQTPAARAVIADAMAQLEHLEVTERFGLKPPKLAWIPILTTTATLLLWAFLPEWVADPNAAQAESVTLSEEERESIVEPAKQLVERTKEAREKLDTDEQAETSELLGKIAEASEELSKSPVSKEKALSKLNSLNDELEKRRNQMPIAQVSRQLQQLKQLANQGPADRFSRNLSNSDFRAAAEEFQKMQQRLANGEMSDSEREKLAEQMAEMKQKLDELADFRQRKEQLDEALKNGGLTQQEYEQQMNQLEDQARNMEALKNLAQQMANAQQAMQNGNQAQAAQAMAEAQQQLQQLASEMSELEALDSAMADLQEAKGQMNGDQMMNQVGQRLGNMSMAGGSGFGDQNGFGMGRGRGQGDRPIAPDQTNTIDSKVKLKYGKGAAVMEGTAPPAGIVAGQSVIDIQGELTAPESTSSADALNQQRVPAHVKRQIKEYFERVNGQQ